VEVETRILKSQDRWVEEAIRSYADLRVNMAHSAVYELGLDEKEMEAVAFALQILDTSVDPYISTKGRDSYAKRVLNESPESERDRQMVKFFKRTAPEKISHDMINGARGFQGAAGEPAVQPFSQWLHTQQPEGDE
jgi:hypothetical protein